MFLKRVPAARTKVMEAQRGILMARSAYFRNKWDWETERKYGKSLPVVTVSGADYRGDTTTTTGAAAEDPFVPQMQLMPMNVVRPVRAEPDEERTGTKPSTEVREYVHRRVLLRSEHVALPWGVTLEAFQELLNWWHGGDVGGIESSRDIFALMCAARYYLDSVPFRMCEVLVCRQIHAANVVDVLLHAAHPLIGSHKYVPGACCGGGMDARLC